MLVTRQPPARAAQKGIPSRGREGAIYLGASIALLGYAGATMFLLSQSITKIYGFPVSHDVRTQIEIALQACPMLAAIFMVLASPAREFLTERLIGRAQVVRPDRDNRIYRTAVTLAVNAILALAILAATAFALVAVCGPSRSALSPVTLWWVAGEFTFDLMLIGIFTTALYAVTRRLWLSLLLFTAYIAFVVFAGRHWGITSYIGFASGVPVLLTTYSDAPLYDAAGWMFRGYWACVALLLLSVLHFFSRAFGSRSQVLRPSLYFSIAALVLCVLAGVSIFRLQTYGLAKYKAASRFALPGSWKGEEGRLYLTRFKLLLNYTPREEAVAVRGSLQFANDTQSIHSAYFQLPALLHLDNLRVNGAGKYRTDVSAKYIRIQFENPLLPGKKAEVQYSGRIRAAGPFDLNVQAKVLPSGFFLTDSDFLLAARSISCIEPAQMKSRACGNTENYLTSDSASGEIIVTAPRELTVASPGEESIRSVDKATSEHVFNIAVPRLATFMVACAPFVQKVAISDDRKTTVHVYGSAAAAANGGYQAALAQRILSFYGTAWPAYSRPGLQVIETPAPLVEAVAFDGAIAIGDKIVSSRNPVSGSASSLLEFVMAHEIAHQWWGYRVVSARSPGRVFLLESFPQFAAYKYLSARGLFSEQKAVQNEKRRYQAARPRLRKSEVPLAQLETANELAYNRGPFVLFSLDKLGGGLLMNRLGDLITAYSHDLHGNAEPAQFLASLVEQVPEKHRQTARALLYKLDSDGVSERSMRSRH